MFGVWTVRCNNGGRMPTPTAVPIRRPGLAHSTMILVCLAMLPSAAAAQVAPLVRLSCGGYEAVPSATAPNGQPTRLSVQKDVRLLLTVSDYSILRTDFVDFGNDGVFEMVVATYTG